MSESSSFFQISHIETTPKSKAHNTLKIDIAEIAKQTPQVARVL